MKTIIVLVVVALGVLALNSTTVSYAKSSSTRAAQIEAELAKAQ